MGPCTFLVTAVVTSKGDMTTSQRIRAVWAKVIQFIYLFIYLFHFLYLLFFFKYPVFFCLNAIHIIFIYYLFLCVLFNLLL